MKNKNVQWYCIALSITPLSLWGLIATLGVSDSQHNNTHHNAMPSAVFFTVLLSALWMSVIMVRVMAPLSAFIIYVIVGNI